MTAVVNLADLKACLKRLEFHEDFLAAIEQDCPSLGVLKALILDAERRQAETDKLRKTNEQLQAKIVESDRSMAKIKRRKSSKTTEEMEEGEMATNSKKRRHRHHRHGHRKSADSTVEKSHQNEDGNRIEIETPLPPLPPPSFFSPAFGSTPSPLVAEAPPVFVEPPASQQPSPVVHLPLLIGMLQQQQRGPSCHFHHRQPFFPPLPQQQQQPPGFYPPPPPRFFVPPRF